MNQSSRCLSLIFNRLNTWKQLIGFRSKILTLCSLRRNLKGGPRPLERAPSLVLAGCSREREREKSVRVRVYIYIYIAVGGRVRLKG